MSGRQPRGQRGRGDMPFRPRGGYEGSSEGSRGGYQGRGRGNDSYSDRGGAYRGGGRGDRGGRGGRGGATVDIVTFRPTYPENVDSALQQRETSLLTSTPPDTSVDFPRRPAYGSRGEPITLWANYFKLEVKEDVVLYRYDVKVTPVGGTKAPAKAIVKRIIALFIEDHIRQRNKADAVSDFRATLIAQQQLNEDALSASVTYRAEGEPEPEDGAKVFEVKLTASGTLTLDNLLNFTTSTNASAALQQRQEVIQALNLVVGYYPKTSPTSITVGRNLHVSTAARPEDRWDLRGGLEALRSFVFSVRAATERLLINVQIKNLPFYPQQALLAWTQTYLRNGQDLPGLMAMVSRLSVEVTHIQRRSKSNKLIPRYKTIDSLARPGVWCWLPEPPRVRAFGAGPKNVEFWFNARPSPSKPAGSESAEQSKGKKKKDKASAGPRTAPDSSPGHYISVYEYFRQHYPSVNLNAEIPVVNVGSRADPSYLPMEVCDIRPGQVARSKITPDQTREMLKFAVRQPSANAASISTQGLGLLGLQGANQYMSAFGLTVEPKLITVPARVLQSPKVVYSNNRTPKGAPASWNLTDMKLQQGTVLQNWAYVTIRIADAPSPRYPPGNPADFMSQFGNTLIASGMRCEPPRNLNELAVRQTTAADRADAELKIEELIKFNVAASGGRFNFLLVIMPENTTVYNTIKYVCDVKQGILSQCAIDAKFAKDNNTQYFANIGLKINLKLGGINHSIQKTQFGNVNFKTTMFVGIDVTHPSPGSLKSAPSVAGIVSSIDGSLGQWPAAIRAQTGRQEMVDALDELLQGQLRLWQKKNKNTLPSNIIVYRDGVSEGQYQVLLDNELPSLKKAIDVVYSPADKKQYNPRLSIIVVGKRHHTRFYPTKTKDEDPKTGNPKNGTVVDRGVTELGNWDFFLQAHSALKGTAKPAHYYVVYDEALRGKGASRQPPGNAADSLEELTHSLCYLFGRATKAVSVCPPAYYADLVCERARCYLAQQYAPSPPMSSAASDTSDPGRSMAAMQSLINVHPNIRERMFYI
ncbi:hypothetical protein AMS68_002303 [Peltaster fructicola]|uniref:Piwi domain-containing protein n=1 Tax=Peltaster fructicola TaxID=286661 RepID=A0A6H0XQ18_9PEZI|nr:hypothetical protein AMS68_002303 [Peltaster fructicola]